MPANGNNPIKAVPKKERNKKDGEGAEAKTETKSDNNAEAPKKDATSETPKNEDTKEAPKDEAAPEAPKGEEKK